MRSIVIGIVFLLGGCASQQILPPNMAPTVSQIASKQIEYKTVSFMSPITYMNIGMGIARDQCLTYFNQLVEAQDKRVFASNEGSLLAGVGTGAAIAAGVGPTPLAALGLASMLFQGTLANVATAGGAGAFPDTTAGLILDKAMGAYRLALPVPATIDEADFYVHGFAAECSSVKIHQYVKDAIGSARMGVISESAPIISSPVENAPISHKRPTSTKVVTNPPPASLPPSRQYPPSLFQQQWSDVQKYGRNAIESGRIVNSPIIGVIH